MLFSSTIMVISTGGEKSMISADLLAICLYGPDCLQRVDINYGDVLRSDIELKCEN